MIKLTKNIGASIEVKISNSKKVVPSILTSQSVVPSGLFISCNVNLSSSPAVKKKSLFNLRLI